MALCTAIGLCPFASSAAQLSQANSQAFDQYVRAAETHDNDDISHGRGFLWIDRLSPAEKAQNYSKLHAGEILIQNRQNCAASGCSSLRGALIHDWIGLVFVPGVSLSQTLSLLQDYDHDAEYYSAQVMRSRLLTHSGNEFRVDLRLKQTEIITVVFDTEYDIRYRQIDSSQAYSRSYSTRIVEVENAGTPQERILAPGKDHGFLWRLNSYWRFHQADGGVYIQCEAISLTRDVPTGLGWLIGRFIERIPAESLRSTLSETRAAVLANTHQQKEKTT